MRRQATMVAAALLTLAVVGGGLTAGPAVANGGPGTGWTATPVAPVASVWVPGVHVLASAPAWAFDRVTLGPSIPVSWRPDRTLPSGTAVQYDVEFRWGSSFDKLGWEYGWVPFLTATSSTSAVFNQSTNGDFVLENADAVEFRVRTVDPASGLRGSWSAPVLSNIPMDDNWHHQTWEHGDSGDLTFGRSWITYAYAGDFYGAEHTTTAVTRVVGGLTPFHGPRLVIIGMKCAHCGKFRIDMQGGRGGDTFTKAVIVDTHASSTRHRVVLCDLPIPDDEMWLFQIDTLATPGRPRVSIDAWGVTHAA